MTKDPIRLPLATPIPQTAVIRISAGRCVDVGAKLRLTPGGLLAIGGLISSILLSTAVLVGVATRHRSNGQGQPGQTGAASAAAP